MGKPQEQGTDFEIATNSEVFKTPVILFRKQTEENTLLKVVTFRESKTLNKDPKDFINILFTQRNGHFELLLKINSKTAPSNDINLPNEDIFIEGIVKMNGNNIFDDAGTSDCVSTTKQSPFIK